MANEQKILYTSDMTDVENIIELGFESRADLNPDKAPPDLSEAVAFCLAGLNDGSLRVASKENGEWKTHQWLKKAVLLSFCLLYTSPSPRDRTRSRMPSSA